VIKTKAGRKVLAIQWRLAKKSKRGGQIIQHLTTTDASGKQTGDFWEAWQVPANSKFTTFHGSYGNIDDVFSDPSGTTVHAEARFYEGLNLPDSFQPKNPDTSAQDLPSTTENPNLPTNNATDPVDRTWTAP
jgi:hypothetical protein